VHQTSPTRNIIGINTFKIKRRSHTRSRTSVVSSKHTTTQKMSLHTTNPAERCHGSPLHELMVFLFPRIRMALYKSSHTWSICDVEGSRDDISGNVLHY